MCDILRMEIGLRILGLLIVSIVVGYFTMRSAAKPSIYNGETYELRISSTSKAVIVFIWASALVLFALFFKASLGDTSIWFIVFWRSIFVFLGLTTTSALTTRITYDNHYLYVEGLLKSRQYDWSNLVRAYEYTNISSAGVLYLKFKGKFWVGIPTDYEGFDHFQRFAKR